MPDEPEPKPKVEREIDLDEELVAEAFEPKATGIDRLLLEKRILCVAFLLDACAEEGDAIESEVACGLAEILRGAAKHAARLRKLYEKELRELRGDEPE